MGTQNRIYRLNDTETKSRRNIANVYFMFESYLLQIE